MRGSEGAVTTDIVSPKTKNLKKKNVTVKFSLITDLNGHPYVSKVAPFLQFSPPKFCKHPFFVLTRAAYPAHLIFTDVNIIKICEAYKS